MNIKSLTGKKIAILGFGVTGREVFQCLSADHDLIVINDTPVDGVESYTYEQFKTANLAVDIIVKSPGVPYSHPMLLEAAVVTNDIELSYEYIIDNNLKTKIVAVTGTNGKTTTTYFINQVLNAAGFKSETGGNIGQSPLLTLANNSSLDYVVLELSSYQLKQVNKFKPNCGLFLNITPDHIDYHGGFEDYLNSKCNLFSNMTSDDVLVIGPELRGNHPEVKWPSFATTGVNDDIAERVTSLSMPRQNYILIIDLLLQMGIDLDLIIDQINSFNGLEHRIETVETDYPFTVINDSKATNVEATNVAIKGLNRPTVLIVGGSEKVEDYTLLDADNENIIQVISYGGTRDKFDFIDGLIKFEVFADAVKYGLTHTPEDGILLLSPACASFDQHNSYRHRGTEFKQIARGKNE